MSRFLALLKRELRSITKEKTIMFAILVQFFVASLSSIILVGIMAFYDPASISEHTSVSIRVGVVGDNQGMLTAFLEEGDVRTRDYPNMKAAEWAFTRHRIDAIVQLPPDTSGVVDMKLVMPEMDTQQTVVFMMLDEPLKRYENFLRAGNGVALDYAEGGGKPSTTYEFLYSIIVPILMLFPALIAGSIVIDTISEEFENKTFDTLTAAPVSLGQVFGSKITAAIVTAVVQIGLWVGLLRLNDIVIQNAPLVMLLAVVLAAAVSFIAAVMALFFKDRERTQFVYSIVLVALIGGSYLLNPSPFGLITRLASGDAGAGIFQVALYTLPLLIIGFGFARFSRRLVLSAR